MKPSTTIPLFLSAAAHSPSPYAATAYTPSSKASKSSQDDCPPTPNDVNCGDEFNSGVVYLGGNLICESIENPDGSLNAAITVRGEGTVVDCQGYTVSQVTNSSAAAMDCGYPRATAKERCGLSYLYGIKAYDGATVRNCNIQKFWVGGGGQSDDFGIGPLPGATFENIEASLNYFGLLIDATDSVVTQHKVINSNFYNNGGNGVSVFSFNGDPSTEQGSIKAFIDDVVSKNNGRNGISVSRGSGSTIRNIKAVNNAGSGIVLVSPNNITLDGHVYANNNGLSGASFYTYKDDTPRTVNVAGDLIAERNVNDGIFVGGFLSDFDVTMVLGSSPSSPGKSGKAGSSGSVKACMNGNVDIDGPFDSFKGDDYNYTCDGDLSKCNECYPGCFA